ncbi:TonB-dependent receptor domain-containing protein [Steroidobacter flavus]|uniref:TonB-dependent receptor domain-containing protein n=1 Tax=Steroidobacter flavus TaxID=1842136 RepID=A0ABV8T5Q4_9GAMM
MSIDKPIMSPLLAAMIAGILAASSVARAQEAQPAEQTEQAPRRFDIPSGSLASALNRLADLSGLALVYPASLVQGMSTRGLSGNFSAQQALSSLLEGTGLRFRMTGKNTITIEKATQSADTRVLGPVRVEGADQSKPQRGEGTAQLGGVRGGQDQEARGVRPVVAAVGAGSPVAIEDIPRSVSVLTQEQMEAQDVQDFDEAVRRLPGLSMIQRLPSSGGKASGAGGTIYSRGFSVTTVQVDGGAPRSLDIINNGLLDLTGYERVELVRGANGVFAGINSPGGTLNLVRKRPGGAPSFEAALTAGTDDRYQAKIDWSTPSVLGSPIAFRTAVSHEDQRFAWDNDHLKRTSLYGIFDMPLGDRARLELGAQYLKIREDGFYTGSYRYYDGPNLATPFTFNYTPQWAFLDAESKQLFTRFYVRLLNDWNFDIGLNYSHQDKRSLDAVINGSVFLLSNTNAAYQTCNSSGVCRPRTTNFFAREGFYTSETLGTDFRVAGKFDTWGLTHDVYFAGDFNEVGGADTELSRSNPSWTGVFSLADFMALPSYGEPAYFAGSVLGIDTDFKNTSSAWGLAISDTISWHDRVSATASARRQGYETSGGRLFRRRSDGEPYNISLDEISNGAVGRAPEWRPSYAAAVKPLRDMTVYGSYAEGSSTPEVLYSPDGKQLGATTYKNIEYGVKYGVGDWLLTASNYRLKQDGVAVQIPGTRGQCGPTPTSSCYYGGGVSIESTGYELEAVGRLFEQLDVAVSFTDNRSVSKPSDVPFNTRSPEKLGKLFMNWDVPWLSSLSVNLGAIYTGRIFEAGTRSIYDAVTFRLLDTIPYAFEEDATLIWDLGARYRLNDNIDVSLLVENVADTDYYSTVSSVVNHIGNPRTALLKVTWRDGGDRSGYTPSPTTGLAPFGEPSAWYGSLDFGQQRPEDWKAESTGRGSSGQPVKWTFETTPAEAFYARIGYRLNDHWRTEGEVGFRQHGFGKIGGNQTVPYGLCGLSYAANYIGRPEDRLAHCYDPQGEGSYWSFIANAIRDFGAPGNRFRPYVGLGIGATRASVDFSGRLDGYTDNVYRTWYRNAYGSPLTLVAPGEEAVGGGSSWGLTYQLLVGMSWRITDRTTLDASYKYIRDELDVKTANLTDYYPREYAQDLASAGPEPDRLVGAGLPQLGSFKGDLNSHAFTIGLRWAFGAPGTH